MGVLLVFWSSLEKPIKPIKTNPTVKKPSKKPIKPKNQCFETYVAYGSRMCKESPPDIGFIGFLVFPRKTNKTNKNQSNHQKNLQKTIKPKNKCFETYVAYGGRMCKESLPDIGFIGFLVFPRKTNKTNKNQSNHQKTFKKTDKTQK